MKVIKHIGETGENPYTFDHIFQPGATQKEVYIKAAQPITNAVLEGYNGTIFAYGQTSSGKTFTMTGNPDDLYDEDVRGIIPRTVDALFDGINDAEETTTFTLAVQYVEIYMERVRDLLDPELLERASKMKNSTGVGSSTSSSSSSSSRLSLGGYDGNYGSYKNNLPITEDENGVPGIPGAEKVYVASPNEIYQLLSLGNNGRATSSTNMNEQSSRSHAVFILTVEQTNPKFKKKGVLYLVDLAGSEKVKNTGAKGMRLDEAKKINMSLSTLGRVINKLTSGSAHVRSDG
jgi:kinesin family protein 5